MLRVSFMGYDLQDVVSAPPDHARPFLAWAPDPQKARAVTDPSGCPLVATKTCSAQRPLNPRAGTGVIRRLAASGIGLRAPR
jgi:hypothetical protein